MPTCIELFAGGGGAALGLRRAGYQSLACVEANAPACATLRAAGFPAVQAWIGETGRGDLPPYPDGEDAFEYPDLVWASPPCQPYSRAGRQAGAEDERDGWPAALRAIRLLRPKWVVVENVVGFPAELAAAQLREAGFASVAVWDLDAVRYGLPSRRRRVYLVGRREGALPQAPAPTHYAPEDAGADQPRLFGAPLRRYVTMGEALRVVGEVLPEQRYFCRSTHPDETGFGACTADRRSELVYRPEETAWKAASRPEWLDRPAPTVVTVEVKGTRACAATGWGWSGGPDRASDAAFLATGRRRLTPEECAILVGFPSDYPFQGTKVDKYRQIGNAVAPVMGEVVGRGISAR
jgi:DNA (cytosine-5)-methyltransferase 1